MNELPFTIVDVFARQQYTGNQLAVCRPPAPLSAERMQSIAREMNFSETTFILSSQPKDGGYDVRIFTPLAEVPFAGHPTLGTAHVIRDEILRGPVDRIVLNLAVGRIPVSIEPATGGDDMYWMRQNAPQFADILDISELAPVLGLPAEDFDTRFAIQEVSTGLPHIVVPVKGLDALQRIRIDREKYFTLVQERAAKPVIVFCPEPHEAGNDISVRMFADFFGVPEDPATGSGNGCLAAYLVKHRYWGKNAIDIRSEQGYEIGRPSLLHLRAQEKDGVIEVHVGGEAISVAKGSFI